MRLRDEFNKSSIVKLRIPSVLGALLNQMIDIQGNSHALRQLSKVRYDFVHIPKIGGGKGAVHTIKVTEMSRAFYLLCRFGRKPRVRTRAKLT